MTTLRSYHYDYPRLAKESGYAFHLYRGRVNWSDIENLNIHDITDNRNFQLLEQNLINVINCNLEKEYDLKILDQNLVKLFKLAQLGVDYLSYCELYLDNCVILLQEQLIAVKKECQLLKQQKLKKNRQSMVNKKKESQKYQCEKCKKIFISEIYLKCHYKRRHIDAEKSQNIGKLIQEYKNTIYSPQLTEKKNTKLSVSTQTFSLIKKVSEVENKEEETEMKLRNYKKIENLEREVDDLKNRLKKAEKLLKNEGANLNPTFPFNFSSPIFYSSMLPLVPSSDSLSLGTNNCLNVQPSQMFVPETRQIFSTDFSKETLTLNVPNNNDLATNLIGNFQPENDKCKKETQREKEVENMQNIKESEKNSEMGDFAIENQENINPDLKTEKISSLSLTPVPLPRKAKQLRKTEVSNENKTSAESPRIMEITSETGEKNFNCKSISCSSLTREERKEENFCLTERNLTKGMNNSMGNLKAKEKTSKGNKTGSFIQKILVSSSPSLLELKKNFMKSFNNLYDSVSVSARESTKSKKNIFRSNKGDFPDTHSNVKPCFALKETKKPNVKEIKHETKGKEKMVAKKKTESRLFKKLDQVHLMFGSGTSVFSKSHSESEKQISAQGSGNQKNKKSIEKLKGSLMYDIETEFESEESELRSQKSSIEDQESLMSRNELNRMLEVGSVSESEKSQESKKKEMDFSVFQVRKNKNSKSLWDEKEQNEPNESIAETDSENDFAENSTIGRLKIDQLSSISGDTDVGSHTSVKNSRR